MGAIGKGKAPIATQVPEEHAALVKARGERLEWTISKTAARIIEMWVEAGAPSLSDADKALPPLTLDKLLASPEWGVAIKGKPEIRSPHQAPTPKRKVR